MSPLSSAARQKYAYPKKKLASAMEEVHKNIPKNVKKTGKTGKAKEAMLRAIGFSKAGLSRKKK